MQQYSTILCVYTHTYIHICLHAYMDLHIPTCEAQKYIEISDFFFFSILGVVENGQISQFRAFEGRIGVYVVHKKAHKKVHMPGTGK